MGAHRSPDSHAPPPARWAGGGLGGPTARFSMGYSGFSARGRGGKTYRERFPSYQTCHRRFQQWVRAGVLRRVLETLAEDLRTRGELDLSECFIDATFIVAKKNGWDVGATKRGKGTKTHGGGRPPWSSCRRPHGLCCAP